MLKTQIYSGEGTVLKKNKIVIAVVVLLGALCLYRIGSFAAERIAPAEDETKLTAVKTATVEYMDISKATPMSGRISPAQEAAIVPLAAGQVTKVNVKVGDYVKAGTVLFEIDKGTVSGSYTQAKAAYDLARTTYSNMEKLYSEGAISKSDYDSARVSYISAQENYKLAAEQYSNFSPSSPIDGYVTSMNVSVGNVVATGSVAASVANTDELEISTTASEYIAGLLNVGDSVEVYVDNREKPYTGVVETLSPAPAYGTFTYPITISLDNSSGELMSGQFAEIRVTAEESKNALCVPSDALIMKNGKTVLVLVNEEGIASYSEATYGIDNGEVVEILSGAKKGDKVVISGQSFISDGEKVRVVE